MMMNQELLQKTKKWIQWFQRMNKIGDIVLNPYCKQLMLNVSLHIITNVLKTYKTIKQQNKHLFLHMFANFKYIQYVAGKSTQYAHNVPVRGVTDDNNTSKNSTFVQEDMK